MLTWNRLEAQLTGSVFALSLKPLA